jgi:RNA polymerase sigma-70 factor (ECF subfamily)
MTPLLAQRLRTDRSFERLYQRHAADVYHYALALCRNQADAEDVTQTTFLNAYRAVQEGEQPRAPRNWLIAIAHNVCRQRFRHATRRPDEVELDDGIAAFVPDEAGPTAEDIRRALSELAFNQRAALVMRELEGRSYAEIAATLDLSVSAVETLIFRARRALREQLEGALTCGEAELALSKQLDGRLPRSEKGALRAHLRACKECSSFARSQRAHRSALKGLAAIPLPSSLASFFGGGGAAVGTALATKAAAVTAVGLLVTGVGVETAKQHPWRSHTSRARSGSPQVRELQQPASTPSLPAAFVAAAKPEQNFAAKHAGAEGDRHVSTQTGGDRSSGQGQSHDETSPVVAQPSASDRQDGQSGQATRGAGDKQHGKPATPGSDGHGKVTGKGQDQQAGGRPDKQKGDGAKPADGQGQAQSQVPAGQQPAQRDTEPGDTVLPPVVPLRPPVPNVP